MRHRGQAAWVAAAFTGLAVGFAAADEFFPLGLYGAGMFPPSSRQWACCPGPGCMPDVSCTAPEWNAFDDVAANSAFNVVQDYFYRTGYPSWVQFGDVECFLESVEAAGLKAMVSLPRWLPDDISPTCAHNVAESFHAPLNAFQRALTDSAAAMVARLMSNDAVYGWYLADEPIDITHDAAFHSIAVSAEKLEHARNVLRGIDGSHPMLITLPDYDSFLFNSAPWPVSSGDDRYADWRWNNDGPTREYRDPCCPDFNCQPWIWNAPCVHDTLCTTGGTDHCGCPGIELTQDYTFAADIIQDDTYVSVTADSLDLEIYTKRLRQQDDLVASQRAAGGAAQVVISVATTTGCPDSPVTVRPSADKLRYETYASIIHGMEGVWYWSYDLSFDDPDADGNCTVDACIRYGPPGPYFTGVMAPLSFELAGIEDHLLGTSVLEYHWEEDLTDGDPFNDGVPVQPNSAETWLKDYHVVHQLMKNDGAQTLLMTANAGADTLDILFDISALPDAPEFNTIKNATMATVHKLGTTQTVPISSGTMAAQYLPYEVRLYEFVAPIVRVPDDEPDLQVAIDNAAPGTIVQAAPGTVYAGDLLIKSGVNVQAAPGAPMPEVDATGNGYGVFIPGSAGPGTGISGFYVHGATGTGVSISLGADGVNVTDCVIEGSNTGILVNNASATLDGNRITASYIGLNATEAVDGESFDVTVTDNVILGPAASQGVGVVLSLPESTPTFENNTVLGWSIGAYFDATAFMLVARSVFTGNDTDLWCNGQAPAFFHCTSFGNGVNWNCAYTPMWNDTFDPMLCDDTGSVHVNSPCLSWNSPWSEDIGAHVGVGCASGTLAASATLDDDNVAAGTIAVPSDFRVPSGLSLDVSTQSGLTFEFDDTDEADIAGRHPTKTELLVEGSLTAAGIAGAPVRFVSGETPAEGDWHGIDARSAATFELRQSEVRHATVAVRLPSNTSPSLVRNCVIGDNLTQDVSAIGWVSAVRDVSYNTIDVGGGEGVKFVDSNVGARCEYNTITVSGNDGVIVNPRGTHQSDVRIHGNVIALNGSNSRGVRVLAGTPSITTNVIDGGKFGIYVSGGDPAVGDPSDPTSGNTVTNATVAGLYVTGGGTGGTARHNTFTQGANGVRVDNGALPDLGTAVSPGLNDLCGNSTNCLLNTTAGSVVSAQGNYTEECPGTLCITGDFDVTGQMCCSMPSARLLAATVPLRLRVAGSNPTRSTATLRFDMGATARAVRVEVFDASGRRVRRMADGVRSPGTHEIVWDGRNDRGWRLASGVYFVRVDGPGLGSESVKVLVTR